MLNLRWNKSKHFKSWTEKKPVEVVDVCCQVEKEEEQGEHNDLDNNDDDDDYNGDEDDKMKF